MKATKSSSSSVILGRSWRIGRQTLNGKGAYFVLQTGNPVAGSLLFYFYVTIVFPQSTEAILRHLSMCISIHLAISLPFALQSNYCHEYLCFCARTSCPGSFWMLFLDFGTGKVTAGWSWTPAVVLQEHTLSGKSSGQVWNFDFWLHQTLQSIRKNFPHYWTFIRNPISDSRQVHKAKLKRPIGRACGICPLQRQLIAPDFTDLCHDCYSHGQLNWNRFSLMHISQKQIAVECH